MEATAYSVECFCPSVVCRQCIRNDYSPEDLIAPYCFGCDVVPDGFEVSLDLLETMEEMIDDLKIILPVSWPSDL